MESGTVLPANIKGATIRSLASAIDRTIEAESSDWEMVFVDDGSSDNTWRRMREVAAQRPRHVRALRLRRNFGKAMALAAVFRACRGNVVFTMDADLQDDPAEIPRFLIKHYDDQGRWH
jgi:glycosyltransferase involved in cell wall biosynthesis